MQNFYSIWDLLEDEEEKVPKDWALGPAHIWGKKKKGSLKQM